MSTNVTDGYEAIATVLHLCADKLPPRAADTMLDQVLQEVLPLSGRDARLQRELIEDAKRKTGGARRNFLINSTALYLDAAIARREHLNLFEAAQIGVAATETTTPAPPEAFRG